LTASCFGERLEHYLPLTGPDKAALARLEEHQRLYRRGMVIRRENERAPEFLIIRSGWSASYVLLQDGSRQILRLHLTGDLVGTSSAAFAHATESLMALTDVRVCPFDRTALRHLFEAHPRIAALIFVIAQAERASLTDRLASLGRTSAKSRIAALLIDTLIRLRLRNPELGDAFPFPLTQEEIGDATGLTSVHVNRMMRALVEDGLIARSNSHLTIVDERRLSEIANYVNRHAAIDPSWVPPAS
jgi:CRP-like cAMP-binding protein